MVKVYNFYKKFYKNQFNCIFEFNNIRLNDSYHMRLLHDTFGSIVDNIPYRLDNVSFEIWLMFLVGFRVQKKCNSRFHVFKHFDSDWSPHQ